jgi:hypothetical protein
MMEMQSPIQHAVATHGRFLSNEGANRGMSKSAQMALDEKRAQKSAVAAAACCKRSARRIVSEGGISLSKSCSYSYSW